MQSLSLYCTSFILNLNSVFINYAIPKVQFTFFPQQKIIVSLSLFQALIKFLIFQTTIYLSMYFMTPLTVMEKKSWTKIFKSQYALPCSHLTGKHQFEKFTAASSILTVLLFSEHFQFYLQIIWFLHVSSLVLVTNLVSFLSPASCLRFLSVCSAVLFMRRSTSMVWRSCWRSWGGMLMAHTHIVPLLCQRCWLPGCLYTPNSFEYVYLIKRFKGGGDIFMGENRKYQW